MVFNEGHRDTDFRVESDTVPHMLFVEASTNRVGIGNFDPNRLLSLKHASQAEIGFKTGSVSNGALIYYNDSENKLLLRAQETTDRIEFQTGGTTPKMTLGSDGNLLVGTTQTGGVRLNSETNLNGNLAGQFRNTHATGSYGIKVMGGHDSSNYSAVFTDKDNNTLMMIRGTGTPASAQRQIRQVTAAHSNILGLTVALATAYSMGKPPAQQAQQRLSLEARQELAATNCLAACKLLMARTVHQTQRAI